MVTFSTDRMFDGRLGRPYAETDALSPAWVYGKSKAVAERLVSAAHPDALIVRTSAFFGPWDRHNFVFGVLRDLAEGRPVSMAEPDTIVSPTYVPDLAHTTLDLLADDVRRVWHLANDGAILLDRARGARRGRGGPAVAGEAPARRRKRRRDRAHQRPRRADAFAGQRTITASGRRMKVCGVGEKAAFVPHKNSITGKPIIGAGD